MTKIFNSCDEALQSANDEILKLVAELNHVKRELADERSGIQDQSLEKHLRWELNAKESEIARYKQACEVMHEALSYQRRAWQWYATGCHTITDSNEMVKLADNEETTKRASIHRESARQALLEADRILGEKRS